MNSLSIVLFFLGVISVGFANYEPNWASIDSRPLPQWFDEAKIGIFIHWGVFSVPSYQNEWFWYFWKHNYLHVGDYMDEHYPKTFLYPDFAKDFTAEFFNASDWAELFVNSGAKYVVLTSKHHEGFALWPSKYSFNWNAKDVGPGRDLVGELATAVRARNLTFGLYHSLMEWYNPLFESDKSHSFLTQEYVKNKVIPEMVELVETYEPSIFWSDGDSDVDSVSYDWYWNSTIFLAWLYNESPVKDVVVSNDRWGSGTACTHGGFYTCGDRYNPGVLQEHKWENAMTIDRKAWGFRRDARLEDYLTTYDLISELVVTVSCGGNILINVGPTKDGIISPIFQDRLKGLGEWLSTNGDAIYSSKPWLKQNDTLTSNVWYTTKEDAVYAIVLFWPKDNVLELVDVASILEDNAVDVSLLGLKGNLKVKLDVDKVRIYFPDKARVQNKENAYVLKFKTIKK